MYNFTNVSAEVRNVGIDMRYENELLIDEFGINVLYIRNCKFVHCKCFDDLNKTGDPNCPLCMGSGFFASIQKIKANESSNRAYFDNNAIRAQPIGVSDQKNEIYYIRQQYNPKERDYILKVTWDKDGLPVDVVKALEIINIYEMRGDNGRVELNGCIIYDRTDMVTPFQNILKKLPKKAIKQLNKEGGKCIWPSLSLKNSQKKEKRSLPIP